MKTVLSYTNTFWKLRRLFYQWYFIYCFSKHPDTLLKPVVLEDIDAVILKTEERITVLSLLDYDISGDLATYWFWLGIHKESLLAVGDYQGYQEILLKEAILKKHN